MTDALNAVSTDLKIDKFMCAGHCPEEDGIKACAVKKSGEATFDFHKKQEMGSPASRASDVCGSRSVGAPASPSVQKRRLEMPSSVK